eukprot:1840869-Rhodomonas_salina.4
MPDLGDIEALRKIAEGFEKLSHRQVFKDVVGAIDGMLVELHHVKSKDSQFPGRYYTRNGNYALNVQAVCDANRHILYYQIRCPGSVHNSIAWMHTDLWAELECR